MTAQSKDYLMTKNVIKVVIQCHLASKNERLPFNAICHNFFALFEISCYICGVENKK
jgi:hypothetical protein